MAIYHLSVKTISRSAGRSATAAAAYRSGERIIDERTGLIFDYTRRRGVEHTELFIPKEAPAWATDRARLWNAAEISETRKNSTVAREFEVAIPAELNREQRLELVREFARDLVQHHGMAVDVAIHEPGKEGDSRNYHAHILCSTRRLTPDGFEQKVRELDNQRSGEIDKWRERWAVIANHHLEQSGSQQRIDHRSLATQRVVSMAMGDEDSAQSLDRLPTIHLGPNVVQMEQRGVFTELGEVNRRVKDFNAKVIDLAQVRRESEQEKTRLEILERPSILLDLIASKQAVFREKDIERELNRYFSGEDAAILQREIALSPELVNLTPDRSSGAVFSTRDMIATEISLAENFERMGVEYGHAVAGTKAAGILDSAPFNMLSDEQRAAVLHVTTGADIVAVAGAAGSGKSTALAASRQIWESDGYRVRGLALAGKAADGLQESAGIESRTLHSLEYALRTHKEELTRRDVLVIDEAGMVGTRQLGRVIEKARQAGAKVVLVGDVEQLQPIEAGAAFRLACERVGFVEISTIRRQRAEWARQASHAFARGNTGAGLAAYRERDAIHFERDRNAARAALVTDWIADKAKGSRIIFAHTNADVQAINGSIRESRSEAGELGNDAEFVSAKGVRDFAAGDRVVFLKNDRTLGVKNGMLGTVDRAERGCLSVVLDNGTRRTVEQSSYDAVDHGYAVTLHKAQGVTVDRAFVLASGGMDRHLTYVGMTRHRDSVSMYAGQSEFGGFDGLVSRLSRAQPKESVLDFIERRGIADTPRSWIENGRAVLGRLAERFAGAVDQLRERFGPEILKGSEHERSNADRQPTRVTGRPAARADAELAGKRSGKPDIGRARQVPPPFARGRLRNLSELGVVRFTERGEVLLPHHVPSNVEHKGTERDNALRRDSDGLNNKPGNPRQVVQGAVNAAQLRDLVKHREGDRLPIVAANDLAPERIKVEWRAETSRQFAIVLNKARKAHAKALSQMERQEGRLVEADQMRPQEPAGLLASFKKAAHDQALSGWRSVRNGLEKRFNQVRARLNHIDGYMHKAGPNELQTKGEHLADKLAAKARPELATSFKQVVEKEKAAAIELQRAKFMNRRHGKEEQRTMKQESIEELKQRTDANRLKAEKAERADLEKAGFQANLQDQNTEQQHEEDQIIKQQSDSVTKVLNAGIDKGDQTLEAKKREILERFKGKAARDRDNDQDLSR